MKRKGGSYWLDLLKSISTTNLLQKRYGKGISSICYKTLIGKVEQQSVTRGIEKVISSMLLLLLKAT